MPRITGAMVVGVGVVLGCAVGASTAGPLLDAAGFQYLFSYQACVRPEPRGFDADGQFRVNFTVFCGGIEGVPSEFLEGTDQAIIRQDGIGEMTFQGKIKATILAPDGAPKTIVLAVNYQGYFDIGPRGYEEFLKLLRGTPSQLATVRVVPLKAWIKLYVDEPWLAEWNRLFLVGKGVLDLTGLVPRVIWDIRAMR